MSNVRQESYEWVVLSHDPNWLRKGYITSSAATICATESEANEHAERLRLLHGQYSRIFRRAKQAQPEPRCRTYPLKVDRSRPFIVKRR